MIAYKGKHCLKQYLPMKPTKWGFKAFLLCESNTSYCIQHSFFSGPGKEEHRPKNVCLDLCRRIEEQGYNVFADNWYSYYEVSEEFKKSREINYTGTIRATSKGLPGDLKGKVAILSKGEAISYSIMRSFLTCWKRQESSENHLKYQWCTLSEK